MTKMEIIRKIMEYDYNTLDSQLEDLMNQDRITAGARYSVYNPFSVYGLTKISEVINKASASKNYTRYIKRIDSIQYSVWFRMWKDDITKIEEFVKAQTALPFAQTQKQVLIANGELR